MTTVRPVTFRSQTAEGPNEEFMAGSQNGVRIQVGVEEKGYTTRKDYQTARNEINEIA